ncbi:MAG: hypothetical protein K8T20_06030 [Planctomycetes bacterium]|nr:hypothetical protein [Planctomycetota bacterium]
MRLFSFMFLAAVLALYVRLVPVGRPDVDLFAPDCSSIAKQAEELQNIWSRGEYARLMEMCPEPKRAEAIGKLLDGAEKGWASEEGRPELSGDRAAQVGSFRKRFAAIETAAPRMAAGEEVDRYRAAQAELYADICAWIHANHRVSPAMERIFTGRPSIVLFDENRAVVQFCGADPLDAKHDQRVEFEHARGQWMWDLNFR